MLDGYIEMHNSIFDLTGKRGKGKRRNDKYTEWLISDETQYLFDFFLHLID